MITATGILFLHQGLAARPGFQPKMLQAGAATSSVLEQSGQDRSKQYQPVCLARLEGRPACAHLECCACRYSVASSRDPPSMAHTMPSPTTAAEATGLLGSCSGSQRGTSAPAQCLTGRPAQAWTRACSSELLGPCPASDAVTLWQAAQPQRLTHLLHGLHLQR